MPVEDSQTEKPLIIITDDHRATRHLIRNILEPDGYDLLEAENGRELLDLYNLSQPDLVLLDIVMPVMDGLEACLRLRQLPGGGHVPVLMFTAYNEGEEMEKAFQAGASDFINKPLSLVELRHRVHRLLYLRKLEIQRQAAEDELQSSYATIKALSRKVLSAYEEERVRLARELHDEVGTALTTLKLNLQLLNEELSSGSAAVGGRLSSSIEQVNNLLATIRNKALFLRPASLDELGLVAVVEKMVDELNQQTGVHAELQADGKFENLPVEIKTALYRCIQEALTNVARHASATHISMEMGCQEQQVFFKVTDNGTGFDLHIARDTEKHLGLQGMEERVKLLSGKMEINTSPGEGTAIQITIPLYGHGHGER